nr:aromatic amino acid lyase [Nakamurella flavida]
MTGAQVGRIARDRESVALADGVLDRVAVAHREVLRLAGERAVYGRTTGVGSTLTVPVEDDPLRHQHRLLASHAATGGPAHPPEVVRAMLAVRIEQLAVGASGVSPPVLPALVDLLNSDELPSIGRFTSLGTGDIGALARIGLALPAGVLGPGDAMPLMSSNALTLGAAALAGLDLDRLLAAAVAVAGLSAAGLHASPEAFDPGAVGPFPGPRQVAAVIFPLLVGTTGGPERRVQDPYGLRTAAQTLGLAVDAAGELRAVIAALVGAGLENPAVLDAGTPRARVVHHGAFHALHLTAALDGAAAALARAAAGSVNRLDMLCRPDPLVGATENPEHWADWESGGPVTRPYLAAGPATSSGLMGLEYVAGAALGEIRAAAVPAGLQTLEVGLGVEQDAGFAPLAARQLAESVRAARVVLAVELVAAVRALRLRAVRPGVALAALLDSSGVFALPTGMQDRDLTGDLALAEDLLGTLAGHPFADGRPEYR